MKVKEYRAYDSREKKLIYNDEPWLPKPLEKLGHTAYPVHIAEDGIHYTLNCLSNNYEADWEEDVVTRYGMVIMPCTNLWDHSEPPQKMYSHDIISFTLREKSKGLGSTPLIGQIVYQESGEWVVVDQLGHFIAKLDQVESPRVIGNWFDHSALLN